MDGTADFARYSRVGAEAIRFQMEELEYDPSEIPSISTIKKIIKRNKLGPVFTMALKIDPPLFATK